LVAFLKKKNVLVDSKCFPFQSGLEIAENRTPTQTEASDARRGTMKKKYETKRYFYFKIIFIIFIKAYQPI
jgi:hypothetical protein